MFAGAVSALGAAVLMAVSVHAQDAGNPEGAGAVKSKQTYSPAAGWNYPRRVYWGDTHLHTVVLVGRRRLRRAARAAGRLPLRQGRGGHGLQRPAGASCRGRSTSSSSPTTPTTWASSRTCSPASPRSWPTRPARKWYDMIQAGKGARGGDRDHRRLLAGHVPEGPHVLSRHAAPIASAWQETIEAAEEAQRARAASPPSSATSGPRTPAATTCTASSSSATTATRRARSSRSPTQPPLGSDNPRDLWKWMAAYEEKTGGNVLAIAHNGNLSNGRMFPIDRVVHRQADRPRVCRDARASGSGSTRPRRSRATARRIPSCRRTTSSPTSSAGTRATSTCSVPKKPEMLEFEYARSALKNGLKLEAGARRQSLQVRHDRLDRRAHRPRRRRGGQLLRQDTPHRAERRARATHPFVQAGDG